MVNKLINKKYYFSALVQVVVCILFLIDNVFVLEIIDGLYPQIALVILILMAIILGPKKFSFKLNYIIISLLVAYVFIQHNYMFNKPMGDRSNVFIVIITVLFTLLNLSIFLGVLQGPSKEVNEIQEL